MKIATFTVVVGNYACDADCPFCVSKMTPRVRIPEDADLSNFDAACRLAERAGATTMLLTGKGEPLLYLRDVERYLVESKRRFPIVEVQTNGIRLSGMSGSESHSVLSHYKKLGMTMVCLSAVHHDEARNREIYGPKHGLYGVLSAVHGAGLSARLTVMMVKGYVDSWRGVEEVVGFCRRNGVEQLTIRPIERPCSSSDPKVSDWVDANRPDKESLRMVGEWLEDNGTPLLRLPHDGVVYDVDGQNVCFSNCLTSRPDEGMENIRQLIYFPDGHVRYDWRYSGAIIL